MRRRFSDADRRRFYAELDRSGESPWRVARRLGFNPTTVYRWIETREDAGPVFAKVVRSSAAEARSGLEVQVGSVRIVIESSFDPQLLRAVVHALTEKER